MSKKWLVLRAPDDNTGGDSSTPPGDKGQDSPPEQQGDTNADEQQQDDADGQQDDTNEPPPEDGTGEEQADDQQDSQQQEQQDAIPVSLDKPEDKDLPFHKHARFQELIRAKNDVQKQYEEVKPLVEQVQAQNNILRQYNISPQEFQSWIQYGINLRTNKAAALAQIEPIYRALAMSEGKILPEDLEAKVAAATISREDAIELAKARANMQYGQVQQQWQNQGQQQFVGDIITNTTSQWVATKTQSDPDFKQGSDLWSVVNNNLMGMQASGQDANSRWRDCEAAYKKGKEFMAKYQPRPAAAQSRPRVQSRQSNGNNGNGAPKTMEEAIKGFVSSSRRPNALR